MISVSLDQKQDSPLWLWPRLTHSSFGISRIETPSCSNGCFWKNFVFFDFKFLLRLNKKLFCVVVLYNASYCDSCCVLCVVCCRCYTVYCPPFLSDIGESSIMGTRYSSMSVNHSHFKVLGHNCLLNACWAQCWAHYDIVKPVLLYKLLRELYLYFSY